MPEEKRETSRKENKEENKEENRTQNTGMLRWILILPLTFALYLLFLYLVPHPGIILRYFFLIAVFLLLSKFFLKHDIRLYLSRTAATGTKVADADEAAAADRPVAGTGQFLRKTTGAFLLYLAIICMTTFADMAFRPEQYIFSYRGFNFADSAGILVLIITAALAEELIFRAFPACFPIRTTRRVTNFFLRYICPAALFTAAHSFNPEIAKYGIQAAAFYFLFGLTLTHICLKTSSTAAPLGIHIANNFSSAFLFSYPNPVLRTDALFLSDFSFPLSVIQMGLLVLSFRLLCKQRSNKVR